MLAIVLIVITTVMLLIGMDRVSGQHTTDGRRRKAVDDGILNRFLYRRSQRRPQSKRLRPKDTEIDSVSTGRISGTIETNANSLVFQATG